VRSPVGDALRAADALMGDALRAVDAGDVREPRDSREPETLARIGELVLGHRHQAVAREEESPAIASTGTPETETTRSFAAVRRFLRRVRSWRFPPWIRDSRFLRWLRSWQHRLSRWLLARSWMVWSVTFVAIAAAATRLLALSLIETAAIVVGAVAAVALGSRVRHPPVSVIPSRLTGGGNESDHENETALTRSGGLLDPKPAEAVDPPFEPLFLPRWTPGILAAAIAVETGNGPIDIDRIVASLARLELRTPLPRRRRRTLDRGVLVLVDESEGMWPFASDTTEILARVRGIAGPDVHVWHFDGHPLVAWDGRKRITVMDELPQTPRAVLAITNFGRYGPPFRARGAELERDWLELVTRLEHRRFTIIALVPDSPSRVPRGLRQRIAVIEWDRQTSIASAARAVGR